MSKLFGLLNIGFLSNLPDETMEPGFGKETCVDSFHKSYQPNCQKTDAFEVKPPGALLKASQVLQQYGGVRKQCVFPWTTVRDRPTLQ